jgi:hypothetical protein
MWTLIIDWKNISTGKTTKTEELTFHNRRVDAEHFMLEKTPHGENYPVGILHSPTKSWYVVDPHMYYLKVKTVF